MVVCGAFDPKDEYLGLHYTTFLLDRCGFQLGATMLAAEPLGSQLINSLLKAKGYLYDLFWVCEMR